MSMFAWLRDRLGAPSEPAAQDQQFGGAGASGAWPAGKYDAEKFRAHLVVSEGLRLRLYTDTVGKRSIGIGRNLDDVGISEDEAWYLAENDIRRTERDLDRHLPWWRGLGDVRMRVMLDMCFNMGIGWPGSAGEPGKGLRSFVNTLEAIRAGRYDDAADGMLASKWASQVGRRAVKLAHMMRTGTDT